MLSKIKYFVLVFALILCGQAQAGMWASPSGLTACGAKAVEKFKNIADEGLSERDYQYGLDAAAKLSSGQMPYQEADRLINDAMIRYIDQVRNGRFDPKMADRTIIMRPEDLNAPAIIKAGAESGSCEWMDRQEPPYEGYRQLKPVLKKYRQIEAQGPWPTLPNNLSISDGESDSNLGTVRFMLGRLGFLDAGDVSDSSSYDGTLSNAVKAFQSSHGLLADGNIGPLTVKELNKTPKQRVNQILVTMERWRWLPRNPGQRHILINLAGFELQGVENNQVTLRSNIIVGADYRETPVFTANMTEVKFNPSWTVPHNLAVKDKLPKIKENPSYVRNNNFVLTQTVNGKTQVVDANSVNWSNVNSSNFNYTLRQTPGDHNALGKIRFTIDSPFSIYLHSTPDKHLFDYPIRTFSSGCIRVQKVAELGAFAMNSPDWPVSRMQQEMQGNETRVIKMPRSIPVYLNYLTVWTDENGVTHFMPDVYDQDRLVLQAMKRWL